MRKGISFTLVLILTTLGWLLAGYVLRLFFPALSLTVFLFIGLGAGLLLGTLLAFMHEDTVPVPAPEGNATEPGIPSPTLPPSPGRPETGLPGSDFHPQA